MLPQSHIIIAKQIYKHIDKKLNVQLDKKSLIYGSIKPDIPFNSSGVPHFKPDSFDYISNKIYELSLQPLSNNTEFIKYISRNIGIVTHYIADYFCVPHNDRKYYKKHIINHFNYEAYLHKEYMVHMKNVNISNKLFNLDSHNLHSIKSLIDDLHNIYTSKGESFKNDIVSSIEAAVTTGLLIIYNSKYKLEYSVAA
ncbi:MAG: zinc dependent phospholipase C family protein [Clostridiales bacterium]|nr:zinc dependent phospholipase C family protein [Clostridiales bacterium]